MSLQLDKNAIQQFLSRLGPPGDLWLVQTFTDNKALLEQLKFDAHQKGLEFMDPNARIMRVTELNDTVMSQLTTLQSRGAGVFVQVNHGPTRSQKQVDRVRAIFVDADEPVTAQATCDRIMAEMPAPSIKIETSPGKFHMYWQVDDCPVAGFSDAQKALHIAFGTDGSVSNLNRVMRLPGTYHMKHADRPVMVTAAYMHQGASVSSELVRTAAGLMPAEIRQESKVRKSDQSPFGLRIASTFEEPTVLAPGDRTGKLISMIGNRVALGYSEAYIEAEVRRLNIELCPAGADPIPGASLEREILPALHNFIQQREATTYAATDMDAGHALSRQVPQLPSPPASIPALIPAPPPNVPAPPNSAQVPNVPAPPMVGSILPPPRPVATNAPSPPVPNSPSLQVPLPPAPAATLTGFEAQAAASVANAPEFDSLDVWLDRYIYVEEGQKVVDTQTDPDEAIYSLADFEKSKSNIMVGQSKLATKWLGCRGRETVRGTRYYPVEKQIVTIGAINYYNIYHAPEAAANVDAQMLMPWLDHIKFLIPDRDAAMVFIQWVAMTVQKPHIRIPWAPLIISKVGLGKSWMVGVMSEMMGHQNVSVIKAKDLESNYNGYMANNTLIAIEEIRSNNRYSLAEDLKILVTATEMMVNHKFGAQGQEIIYANVIAFSNWLDALILEDGDRRWWVWHAVADAKSDDYYNSLYKWRDSSGPSHLKRWLCNMDLSKFSFGKAPPVTAAKRSMIRQSKSPLEKLVNDCVSGRSGPFAADVISSTLAALHVVKGLGALELSAKQFAELTKILGLRADELPHLITDGGTIPIRAICIRNSAFWTAQSEKTVQDEFNRAKTLSMGLPAPANLKEAV